MLARCLEATFVFAAVVVFLCGAAVDVVWKEPILCEWEIDPLAVADPCPEFSWRFEGQTSYWLRVSDSYDLLKQGVGNVYDSGPIATPLTVAEFSGKPLLDHETYYWQVKVRDQTGIERSSPVAHFTTSFVPLPKRSGRIRTFLNFGERDKFIADHYDLTFRDSPKKYRQSAITLRYSLLATMTIPSPKADMLREFCAARGSKESGILEELFLHLKEDQDIGLHIGRERPEFPIETRRVPGWDPANDRDGNGIVDDIEYASRPNMKANARKRSEARIPIYYWGPPKNDYVMNVAHPLYQDFLLSVYVPHQLRGYDGLFVDTTTSYVPGTMPAAPILEIPDKDAWFASIVRLLGKIKQSAPKSYLIGNGWYADPFMIDGTQYEQWLNIAKSVYDVETAIQSAVALDQRGKIQLLQYRPTSNSRWFSAESSASVSTERDRLFGLASYYLVQGNHTYFGYGAHPYDKPEKEWFPAMEYDLGLPSGAYRVFADASQTLPKENLLRNGGFETVDRNGKPEGWVITEPIESTNEKKMTGDRSVKIVSKSMKTNNINSQYVMLEPCTVYTAGGFISTERLEGSGGAQLYPYGDDVEHIDKWAVFFRGTGTWRFCSFVFRTGKSGKARINFRIKEAIGTAWFDDIFLTKGSYPNWKIFSRQYDKGMVLLKVGASTIKPGSNPSTTIDLENEYQWLHSDGSLGKPLSQVHLRNSEACILVRTPNGKNQSNARY